MKTTCFLVTIIAFGSFTLGRCYAGEPSKQPAQQDSHETHATNDRSAEPANSDHARGKIGPTEGAHSKPTIARHDSKPKEDGRASEKSRQAGPVKPQVCGEAGGAWDKLRLIVAAKPHVAIVDISMQGGSGIELVKKIKANCPAVAVIVLSMHDEGICVERALRAGARGYIMKTEATKNVLPAIRSVLEGKLYLSEIIADMMAEKFVEGNPPATTSHVDLLSDRELEVFQLLGRGLSTRLIGQEMHVSFRTVQAFCARIKQKLKLSNATELLREATRWHGRQNST